MPSSYSATLRRNVFRWLSLEKVTTGHQPGSAPTVRFISLITCSVWNQQFNIYANKHNTLLISMK